MPRISGARKKELIKTKLSAILLKSSGNPAFAGVTIVDVKLSPDSSSAVVFYAMFGNTAATETVTEALNNAAGFFQSKLARSLQSRNTPRLRFVFDSGFDHADRIEQLLTRIHQDRDTE